jgi:hypothetical protein
MAYTTEQMRQYQKARRRRLRAELIAMLGGECWCGSADDLQFDHIDPTTKLFAIASGLDRPRQELEAEVRKCQLLCRPHHIEKSRSDPVHPNRARGERSNKSKLAEPDVLAIRSSGLGTGALAAQYGVSRHTITNIRFRHTWTHI